MKHMFRWVNYVRQLIILSACLLSGVLYSQIASANVDIVVNLNDSPDPVPAGGQLTYTLSVANNGPDDATGVQITNTLPAGVSLVS
ncbi:MAG: DUF11 domain-containing protein, partial [Flavobacteriales bacterium]